MEGKKDHRLRGGGDRKRLPPFARSEVGFREVELANDLWAISIDPDESMRRLRAAAS